MVKFWSPTCLSSHTMPETIKGLFTHTSQSKVLVLYSCQTLSFVTCDILDLTLVVLMIGSIVFYHTGEYRLLRWPVLTMLLTFSSWVLLCNQDAICLCGRKEFLFSMMETVYALWIILCVMTHSPFMCHRDVLIRLYLQWITLQEDFYGSCRHRRRNLQLYSLTKIQP